MKKTRTNAYGITVRDFEMIAYDTIMANIHTNYEISEMMNKLKDSMFEDKLYRFALKCISDYMREITE